MLPFVLTLSAIVGTDPAPAAPAIDAGFGLESPVRDLPAHTWSTAGARGNALAVQMILADVQALSPVRRAEAAESLRILSVTCPYTRASVQLPTMLHATLGELRFEVDPVIADDWEHLVRGVATHVALLDALGADLPRPARGDGLFGRGAPGIYVDRPTLEAHPDPIAATTPLIDGIPALVQGMSDTWRQRIDEHAARFERITGHGPTLFAQVIGWHHALRALAPHVHDPADRARIDAMIGALAAWSDTGC